MNKIHLGRFNGLTLSRVILFGFLIIYCSISLVNHYNFRTFAWDLGINNNAIYDYAHFRWNDCMLMQPQFSNVLSDHFTLLPIFFSPLYWILGSYTMLVIQIASILFGGYGVLTYFRGKTKERFLPEIAMLHFFSIWGIYSALAFDYHDNVIGAMFVPWFLHYFEKRQWVKSSLFFLLILISKENLALWAAFISAGLVLLNLNDKRKIKSGLIYFLCACIYFILVVKFIMPAIGNEGREYLHFKYEALGKDFKEAIITILTRPQYVFTLLFENHLNDPVAYGIKTELHFMILLSGGIALLFKPHYLVMLIPIYAQKLFNDDFGKWGLNYQYSIEFAPILSIAFFSWVLELKSKKYIPLIGLASVIITFGATIISLDNRVSKWYSPAESRFYSRDHYIRDFNVSELYKTLEKIPKNAIVSAQSMIVPHLSFRDFIYQFPHIENADYIILLLNESSYPLSKESFNEKIEELYSSSNWELLYNENTTLVFKRSN